MTLLVKLWPLWVALWVGTISGVVSYTKGYGKGYDKGYESRSVIEIPKCPDCNCPKIPPSNGIDFDKIKGKGIKIENHQHFELNSQVSDSLFRAILREELLKSNVVRCKR
jgi:hypothetical protein